MPAAQIDRPHETPDDTARRMTDAIVRLAKQGQPYDSSKSLMAAGFTAAEILQFGRGARVRAAAQLKGQRTMPYSALDPEQDDLAEAAWEEYIKLDTQYCREPRRALIREVGEAYCDYIKLTCDPSVVKSMCRWQHRDLAEMLTGTADRRAEGLS